MIKDKYYLERIYNHYYDFILSNGTILYLFLATHLPKGTQQIKYTMQELESNLRMSHASIRKYEMILVMMGLLDIEVEYYNMYTQEGYQIKQKKYTLYKPLRPEAFDYAIAAHKLPNLEKTLDLMPNEETQKYTYFNELYNELLLKANIKIAQLKTKTIKEIELKHSTFSHSDIEEDLYSIERIFDIYHFLPQKVVVFYMYLWRYWIQSEYIDLGIHIPRKQIKKELGYGDEQIREAMFILCVVGLLDLQKKRYYRYFLAYPLEHIKKVNLRPISSMYFLLPKHPDDRYFYYKLYDQLSETLRLLKNTRY